MPEGIRNSEYGSFSGITSFRKNRALESEIQVALSETDIGMIMNKKKHQVLESKIRENYCVRTFYPS